MSNAIIRSSYFLQALGVAGFVLCSFLIYMALSRGQYWLVAFNSITATVNIWILISNGKIRKQFTHGFKKNAYCSCGACDWGTVVRQYDEVPVCRNCWRTWKGK